MAPQFDGADGEDVIGLWVQAGRFGVEYDESHLLDRQVLVERVFP